MTEWQESKTNFSAIGDLEIVLSTAEPITRLEISQLISPTVDTLDKAPVTGTKVTKWDNRKQAQGFSPSKK